LDDGPSTRKDENILCIMTSSSRVDDHVEVNAGESDVSREAVLFSLLAVEILLSGRHPRGKHVRPHHRRSQCTRSVSTRESITLSKSSTTHAATGRPYKTRVKSFSNVNMI
jgi:hypothetical protein